MARRRLTAQWQWTLAGDGQWTVQQQFDGDGWLDGKDSNGQRNGDNSMAMDIAMNRATAMQWQWT
jgi:hypothetical protein